MEMLSESILNTKYLFVEINFFINFTIISLSNLIIMSIKRGIVRNVKTFCGKFSIWIYR
jgi:hypothetical protein